MKKRLISVALLLLFAAAAAFAGGETTSDGASGEGEFAKHLEIEWLGWTMRFNEREKADTYVNLQYYQDKYNVTFIWPELLDWSNTEKVAAQLATGRIPEFCAVLQANMAELYDDGMVRPWYYKDIKEKMPKTAKILDETGGWSFLKVPGEEASIGIPQLYKTNGTSLMSYYRLDWLEKLGIEPKGELKEIVPGKIYWSTEGFDLEEQRQILKKFMDSNASGLERTYGMGPRYASIFTCFGQASTIFNQEGRGADNNVLEDGKLKLAYATNAYKDALKWLNKLYNDGILTKETVIAGQDYGEGTKLWGSGHVGWATDHYFYIDMLIAGEANVNANKEDIPQIVFEANPEAKVLVVPMEKHPQTGRYGVSDGGYQASAIPTNYRIGTLGRAALASSDLSDEKFDRAMRIFEDTHADRDGWERNWYGVEGVNYEWTGEAWNSPIKPLETGPENATNLIGGYLLYYLYDVRRLGTPYKIVEDDVMKMDDFRGDYVTNYRYDFLAETNITDIRKKYESGLATTALKYTADFILGNIDIDSGWADYIAELEKNGMKEMLAEMGKAPKVKEYLEGKLEY